MKIAADPDFPAASPLVVGIGGTLREKSTSASALRLCLDFAAARGGRPEIFTGDDLRMPLYEPQAPDIPPAGQRMIAALRAANGIILSSPGYHGSISGTLKNVLDYTEAMRDDDFSYFDGRAVGCIASAAGWQASAATLSALRSIVHALRGWPTPLGVTLNSSENLFDGNGICLVPAVKASLITMTEQVIGFSQRALAVPVVQAPRR